MVPADETVGRVRSYSSCPRSRSSAVQPSGACSSGLVTCCRVVTQLRDIPVAVQIRIETTHDRCDL